jgi:hypothetical protein
VKKLKKFAALNPDALERGDERVLASHRLVRACHPRRREVAEADLVLGECARAR